MRADQRSCQRKPALDVAARQRESPIAWEAHDFSLIFMSQLDDWPTLGSNLLKKNMF